jgi:hypothetical protein
MLAGVTLLSNQIFVSFSGTDKAIVEQLASGVPKRLIGLYLYDFKDGANLLSEMERHVKECAAFIFIVSTDSLQSVWCKHEISLAHP